MIGFSTLARIWQQREAANVRMCDRAGCDQPGNCPAPKSPNSPDRWYFCQQQRPNTPGLGLFRWPRRRRGGAAQAAGAFQRGLRESAYYGWAGSGDGSRSRDEMKALEVWGWTRTPILTPLRRRGARRPRKCTPM
jgi:hypothetical protein